MTTTFVEAGPSTLSSHWQEPRNKWQAAKKPSRRRSGQSYAEDATTFAPAVIEEVATAALDAMYPRVYAQATAPKVGSSSALRFAR